ncbi:DUF4236 domain-containing protein [Sphingosinicella rhizophila]|uniref:DUF4236 domain-containing protein n=1 Tax=Sphingosinicella rhizophila TaxID=3050082 RepID=UPI003965741E
MGFRFRRSLKIAPGIRLNFSRSGISTTIGPKGASLSLGKRGARGNVGVPGTGVSYSTALGSGGGSDGRASPASGCALLAIVGAAVLAIGTCAKDSLPDPSTAASTSPARTAYVKARSLNCRAAPNATASVITGFSRGATLSIEAEEEGWSRTSQGTQPCWVASEYLSDAPPEPLASGPAATASTLLATGAAASSRAMSRKQSAKRTGRRYDDQGCPCSGSSVCVGPRGGRYCITSGGNKRYGV